MGERGEGEGVLLLVSEPKMSRPPVLLVGAVLIALAAVSLAEAGGEVVSASQFMKMLKARTPASHPHRRSAPILSRSEERARVKRVPALESELGDLRKENEETEHKIKKKRSSSKLLALGETLQVKGRLSPTKLSAAEQARLNLETSEAFPDDAKRMSKLKEAFPVAVQNVKKLEKLRAKNEKKEHEYKAIIGKMEDESEYDIMTNPQVAKADAAAQDKLKGLQKAAANLATQIDAAKSHAGKLAREVVREEKLKSVSQKAMLLVKKYEAGYQQKVAVDEKDFKEGALSAAERAAKKKYHEFVKTEQGKLQKARVQLKLDAAAQQERKVARQVARNAREKGRKLARAQRQMARKKARALHNKKRALAEAAEAAQQDVRVKAQAEAMFREYKTAYLKDREMSAQRDLGESDDLGESNDLGESASLDSGGVSPSVQEDSDADENDQLSMLDNIAKTVAESKAAQKRKEEAEAKKRRQSKRMNGIVKPATSPPAEKHEDVPFGLDVV